MCRGGALMLLRAAVRGQQAGFELQGALRDTRRQDQLAGLVGETAQSELVGFVDEAHFRLVRWNRIHARGACDPFDIRP